MNSIKYVVLATLALLLGACSHTSKEGGIRFQHVNDASQLSTVNKSTASVSPFSGLTMYTFTHNFSKAEPAERAMECLGYVRVAVPNEWGEAFGEATTQSVFDAFRDALTDEIRGRGFSETTILVAIGRAIIDGGRQGYERGKAKIVSQISSCYNSGGETWMPNVLGD